MPQVHHMPPQTVPERVVAPSGRTVGNGREVKEIATCPGQVRGSILRKYNVGMFLYSQTSKTSLTVGK